MKITIPEPTMRGPYIVEGALLLTRHEWNGGLVPDDKTLTARRREVGEATVQGEPMPDLGILPPPTFAEAMAGADQARQIELAKLEAASPLRGTVPQADLEGLALFGTMSML